MSGLRIHLQGVGVIGPGLAGWAATRAVLAGEQPHHWAPTVLPQPLRLPAAERRRAGAAIKTAIAVADEACTHAGLDPRGLATVFTSSSGDGGNCHALCEMLAGSDRLVSPTRFTNSVHNAAAGYWHIAVGSQASSTSLCAYDGSWGAGLIEAAAQVVAGGQPVLLVASDAPYPEPLHGVRALLDCVGVALVLTATPLPGSLASLELTLEAAGSTPDRAAACDSDALEALRHSVPAAQGLPLLTALARCRSADMRFDARKALSLRLRLLPSSGAA